MTVKEFQEQIKAGIPDVLPAPKPYDPTINHAPKRKEILTEEERVLAIRNALRYFPAKHHEVLAASSPRSCTSTVVSICIVSVPIMRCMPVRSRSIPTSRVRPLRLW